MSSGLYWPPWRPGQHHRRRTAGSGSVWTPWREYGAGTYKGPHTHTHTYTIRSKHWLGQTHTHRMQSYFACWFSFMALMHFPRVSSELLMFPASFSRSPVLWVREQRSEPARSHRASLLTHTHTDAWLKAGCKCFRNCVDAKLKLTRWCRGLLAHRHRVPAGSWWRRCCGCSTQRNTKSASLDSGVFTTRTKSLKIDTVLIVQVLCENLTTHLTCAGYVHTRNTITKGLPFHTQIEITLEMIRMNSTLFTYGDYCV